MVYCVCGFRVLYKRGHERALRCFLFVTSYLKCGGYGLRLSESCFKFCGLVHFWRGLLRGFEGLGDTVGLGRGCEADGILGEILFEGGGVDVGVGVVHVEALVAEGVLELGAVDGLATGADLLADLGLGVDLLVLDVLARGHLFALLDLVEDLLDVGVHGVVDLLEHLGGHVDLVGEVALVVGLEGLGGARDLEGGLVGRVLPGVVLEVLVGVVLLHSHVGLLGVGDGEAGTSGDLRGRVLAVDCVDLAHVEGLVALARLVELEERLLVHGRLLLAPLGTQQLCLRLQRRVLVERVLRRGKVALLVFFLNWQRLLLGGC